MADSFLTYTANDACERMHQIYTNYCPTKKTKKYRRKGEGHDSCFAAEIGETER